MTLTIVVVLVFFVTLALVVSGLYFFVEAPAARRRLSERFDVVREAAIDGDAAELLLSETMSGIPFFNRMLLQVPIATKLNLFLRQAGVNTSVGMLLTISILSAWIVLLAGLLLNFGILLTLILAMACSSIPFAVVGGKRARRFAKFEEMFPDAIDLLARAVRAGHAFTTGLDLISKEMPSPLSDEFRRTYEQQNLGMPLRDALQNLSRRMPLADVRIFVTALMIQRDSGGNLAEILDNLSTVIRERFKLLRQIKVYTAQARFTLFILLAMPPVTGILLYAMDASYIMRLFTDPMGHQMLAAAVVMQTLGYLVIRKIIQPKF